MRRWAITLCLPFLSGCFSDKLRDGEFTNSDRTRTYKNLLVPPELRTRILTVQGFDGPEVSKEEPRRLEVFVFLKEKTKGVLRGKNWKIQYAPGGGELDFAEYVEGDFRGTFLMGIDVLNAPEGADREIYYLSNAKKRAFGGDFVGSGCDAFYVVSGFFQKNEEQGISLNTTSLAHVSAMAGQYFIIYKKKTNIFLATLDVFDSQHREISCR